MMKFDRFILLLFVATLIVTTQGVAKNEMFLFYRYLSANQGMCLVARSEIHDGKHLYRPILLNHCDLENAAWKWQKLNNNLLQSVKFHRCISAVRDESGALTGEIVLRPCDGQDPLQIWACGFACSLTLGRIRAANFYSLENSLEYIDNRVSGGTPVLRVTNSSTLGKRIHPHWIIYETETLVRHRCVCQATLSVVTSHPYIVTTTGGSVVGKECVFPFILRSKEVWNCLFYKNNFICATAPNLDHNKNSWGVCPKEKRGTWSDLIGEPMCDKTCGGGHVYKSRKCLFPPCKGNHLVKQGTERCNEHPCSGDRIFTLGGHSDQFPASGVMMYLQEMTIGICKFPFELGGQTFNHCIVGNGRIRLWCSLTDHYNKHQKWGYCSEHTSGMWTSWAPLGGNLQTCTRTCGRGHLTLIRTCPNFPTACKGPSKIVGGECNTEPCPECYQGNGINYRGRTNKANDGTPCQYWSTQNPHKHSHRDLEGNFCRNPSGQYRQPFCYRNKGDQPPRMYCDLSQCTLNLLGSEIAYTIPVTFASNAISSQPCKFPYFFESEWFNTCLLLDDQKSGREKCAVVTRDQPLFQYCPFYYRGKWSAWESPEDECTKMCNGGFKVRYRRCLMAPCLGNAVEIDKTKPCNAFPCTWTQPGMNDCFVGTGILYEGNISRTIYNRRCLAWNDATHHPIRFHNNMLPPGIPRLKSNLCRNPTPGVYHGPWCYVVPFKSSNRKVKKWEYCDVSKCPRREGEIFGFTLQLLHARKPCVFPFNDADGKLQQHCMPIQPSTEATENSIRYCRLLSMSNDRRRKRIAGIPSSMDPNVKFKATILRGLAEGTFGICPRATRGTWSPWSTMGECSVICGGGKLLLKHQCLHPPCNTKMADANAHSESCNTHDCKQCLVGNGVDYRGDHSTAHNGKKCIPWSNFDHVQTDFRIGIYKELTNSHCRNPGGLRLLPWCYTSNDKTWFYCSPPHCDDDRLQTIPFTIPSSITPYAAPCSFPYLYEGHWYYSCFQTNKQNTLYYCPTSVEGSGSSRRRNVLSLCPSSYEGRWTAWNRTNTCTKMCGGGKLLYVRECMYPVCQGTKFKVEGSCNTDPCTWTKTWTENRDCFLGEGINYVGDVHTTVSNMQCLPWRTISTQRYLFRGCGINFGDRLCRNPSPGGFKKAPWCYIRGISQTWDYCNIPRCPSREGEVRTIAGPTSDRACHFPFRYKFVKYENCARLRPNSGFYFCSTASLHEQNPNYGRYRKWGYCPSNIGGILSGWALFPGDHRCSKRCGGGKLHYFRRCRVGTCKVSLLDKYGAPCNTHPCEECVPILEDYLGTDTRLLNNNAKCLNWNEIVLNERLYERLDVLGDRKHAFCRNISPNTFSMPACFVESRGQKKLIACDLPVCTPNPHRVETVGAISEHGGKSCRFHKLTLLSCQPRRSGNGAYCATGFVHYGVDLGTCSLHNIGVWGSWENTGKCTKPCERGRKIYSRICRYEPCVGPSRKEEGVCNIQICDPTKNCYDVRNLGIEFQGYISTTLFECKINTELKRRACTNSRNSGEPRPFCISTQYLPGRVKMPIKTHCPIPPCPYSVSPITVKAFNDMPKDGIQRPDTLPCVFPFISRGKEYQSCTSDQYPYERHRDALPSQKLWCGTVTNVDNYPEEWGYCPSTYQGKWDNWPVTAFQCTASCVKYQNRHCRYLPCVEQDWRLMMESCQELPCKLPSWGRWNQWTACKDCLLVQTRIRYCLASAVNNPNAKHLERINLCSGRSIEARPCIVDLKQQQQDCDSSYVAGQIDRTTLNKVVEHYNAIAGGCTRLLINNVFFTALLVIDFSLSFVF